MWRGDGLPLISRSCNDSLPLSFSYISNGRRHRGSQQGRGGWWHRGGRGCVSHLISVPMETDGWRIPLPLTCSLSRSGHWLVSLSNYTCHAQNRFTPLLLTETAAPASHILLPLAALAHLAETCVKEDSHWSYFVCWWLLIFCRFKPTVTL